MVNLDTPLKGVIGSKASRLIKAFGMQTVGDLLRHYPRRLEDRGQLTDFSDLQMGEHATVLAKIVSLQNFTYRPKNGGRDAVRTEVIVTDGQRRLLLTFFRQGWRAGELKSGTVALFSGKVSLFRGQRQLLQPHVETLPGQGLDGFTGEPRERWLPIYPATSSVSSMQIKKSVETVLDILGDVPDPIPEEVRDTHGFATYRRALEAIHRPADREEWRASRERLRYDEALVLQTVLAQRRRLISMLPAVPRPLREGGLRARFETQLPFSLTSGQQDVAAQLCKELARSSPMHRLLQGEVGSGKTVVALLAMLQVVDGGGQAALLAPTEVLAAQHYRSIRALLGPLGDAGMLGGADQATSMALLTGSLPTARRREALLQAASGVAGIVVGTHALLEEQVQFADLGLVVVDEQHRFGVEQRAALTDKGGFTPPHVLVMTATPIPRTVAMTVFGDLDVSTLRELPRGRATISSTVVPAAERPEWLARVWDRIREEVAAGHQAYVVCPRIGGEPESALEEPDLDAEDGSPRRSPLAVADVAADLVAGQLSGLSVYMLHGRQPAEEKDELMRRFAAGDIDVLVSTTVIEVGVDVANATVMVVLDAERFGVSQLHQLRGRVGRGSAAGVCLLVTEAAEGSPARQRLEAVAATSDGFRLAQLDLQTRREGDVLGVNQSGRRSSLRLLSVLRDDEVITDARAAAEAIVATDPLLDRNPALAVAVEVLTSTEQASYLDKS